VLQWRWRRPTPGSHRWNRREGGGRADRLRICSATSEWRLRGEKALQARNNTWRRPGLAHFACFFFCSLGWAPWPLRGGPAMVLSGASLPRSSGTRPAADQKRRRTWVMPCTVDMVQTDRQTGWLAQTKATPAPFSRPWHHGTITTPPAPLFSLGLGLNAEGDGRTAGSPLRLNLVAFASAWSVAWPALALFGPDSPPY
jgi:hypothetical protein